MPVRKKYYCHYRFYANDQVKFISPAQKHIVKDRCATMQILEERFRKNPQLKIRIEQQRDKFNKPWKAVSIGCMIINKQYRP